MRAEGALLAVLAVFAAGVVLAEEAAITRYKESESDRVPLHTVVPAYPRVARRDRVEGRVQVCYQIDRRGRPYRVAVRHSTHRVFERPALRAVKASTYAPLAAGQKTSGIKSCRTFRFKLTPTVADNGAPG